MRFPIILPAFSAGMEDAVIARFVKQPGDRVSKGEIVAEVETDKATMDIEAGASGTLADLPVTPGDRVLVGQPVAFLLLEGENAPETPAMADVISGERLSPEPYPDVLAPVSMQAELSRRHRASPLARRLALDGGVTLASIAGTGPHGRIVRIDIEKAITELPRIATVEESSSPTLAPSIETDVKPVPQLSVVPAGIGAYESVAHSTVRRTIARRLVEAKSTIPHFYLETSCEIDALLALRADLNRGRADDEKISINDFVIKATAGALRAVPDVNVIYTEAAMLRLAAVDIAVAVATPGGLVTPVIRNADLKSIGVVSSEVRTLAVRARGKGLTPDEYTGGSFTISNLGMYGVSAFSAIINPPHAAILAVGAAERKAVFKGDDIVPAMVMQCSLSVDHRVIDGATGGTFLKAFKSIMENPFRIVA